MLPRGTPRWKILARGAARSPLASAASRLVQDGSLLTIPPVEPLIASNGVWRDVLQRPKFISEATIDNVTK
jgi:hypothetical protein